MSKNYDYKPTNENNVSFAGTTENYIFTYTPSYIGMIPVYETAVAGSLQPTEENAPGSFSNTKED